LSALSNLKNFYEAELGKKRFQSITILSSVYLFYNYIRYALNQDAIIEIEGFPNPSLLHDHLRLVYYLREKIPFKALK